MANENDKINIVESEFELCQGQMDKYDRSLDRVKSWAITLWVAAMGWSFETKSKGIVLLVSIAIVMFWILDGLSKSFRQDYKARRDRVAAALREFFERGNLPEDFSSPHPPTHENRIGETFRSMFYFHTAFIYVVLVVVSLLVYGGMR